MISNIDIEDMTDAQDEARPTPISLTYRNWRGEIGQRTIEPKQVFFGSTDWHPDPGWLLEAWDCDKQALRDFALADCQFADLARPSQAGDERVAEGIAIALWREEAAPGTPSVQKLRNADTWADQAPELRDRWMRFARAALAAMDTPKGGGDE